MPNDREVDEEIAFHLEMRTRELIERGMEPRAARQAALLRLGGKPKPTSRSATVGGVRGRDCWRFAGDRARLTQTCVDLARKRDRDMRLVQWIDEFISDVRLALRQMRSSVAFTAVAVLTLALGIGANSAIFALVDAALLRPLPFPQPDRLVMLWERTNASAHAGASPLNVADWNERSRTVERMAGFVPSVGGMVMAGADGTAETVPRQWVTAGIFDALGITPVAGRTFRPDDDRRRAQVVVLTEAFWRSRFGSDPSVVGRSVRLDGDPYTIVGVVPDSAQLIGKTSMWALVSFPSDPRVRGAHMLTVVGRLKPGATLDAAAADMASVADGLAHEFPSTNQKRGVTIEPLHEALIGRDLRRTSILFLAVVGVVLLICCANVANLLLARATVRTRALAIRAALGAGQRRIMRQLLTESLVLSAIGGALAVGVGAVILGIAPALIPEGMLPGAVTLSLNGRVVAFCAVTTLVVGFVFGVAPAWLGARLDPARTLGTDTRTIAGGGGRLRSVLVAGEIATAVVLLVGAGLLLRTLNAVDHVDRGYRAESVLSLMVDPLGNRYPTPASLLQFFDVIDEQLRGLPGVRGIAWASSLPMGDSVMGRFPFTVAGRPPVPDSQRPTADYQIVSPSFFSTLDLPIVTGRPFDDHDTLDSRPVCIVNEAFTRRYLQGQPPIGAHVSISSGSSSDPILREVVGVARQMKKRPDEKEPLMQLFVPLAQDPVDDMYLLVRPASGRAEALTGAVRAAIGRVDSEQLVSVRDIATLEGLAWDAAGRHRFRAMMVMTFAVLALVLAMVGVFGILAYAVQQRVRDFGVRRALGATSADVFMLVVGSAARVIGAGAIVGLVLSVAVSRLLASMLFGVQPLDPATFAAAAIVLALTAGVSIAWPAWRAIRIDPVLALRAE